MRLPAARVMETQIQEAILLTLAVRATTASSIPVGKISSTISSPARTAASISSSIMFYYSAIANAGLGNHAQALEYATTAARMEPNNYSYQNLVTQLSRGSNMYQQRETNYVQPYNSGGWCLRLCLLNMFLNLFCGGRFFCC